MADLVSFAFKTHIKFRYICTFLTRPLNSTRSPESQLRRKWKYLRDNFAVEYTKACESGRASRWQHYDQLLFLQDFVSLRAPHTPFRSFKGGNFSAESGQQELSRESEDSPSFTPGSNRVTDEHRLSDSGAEEGEVRLGRASQENAENQDGPDHHPSTSFSSSAFSLRGWKRKRRAEDDVHKAAPETGRWKAQRSSSPPPALHSNLDSHDMDLFFFQSLLPHVKRIPQHLKLRFQIRIQSVVEEFAYPATPAEGSSSVQQASVFQVYSCESSPSSSHSPDTELEKEKPSIATNDNGHNE